MDTNEKKSTPNQDVKELATVKVCEQCGGSGRCSCFDPWS